jgi:hypothetical protein
MLAIAVLVSQKPAKFAQMPSYRIKAGARWKMRQFFAPGARGIRRLIPRSQTPFRNTPSGNSVSRLLAWFNSGLQQNAARFRLIHLTTHGFATHDPF